MKPTAALYEISNLILAIGATLGSKGLGEAEKRDWQQEESIKLMGFKTSKEADEQKNMLGHTDRKKREVEGIKKEGGELSGHSIIPLPLAWRVDE